MAYTPHTWTTGETVDAAKLNANEQGTQAAAAAADTASAGLSGKVNSSTYTAGLAGKADLPAGGTDGQALVKAGTTTAWATVSGGGAVSDATTTAKGVVQLAGDLSGTAAAPTVAKINGATPAVVATSGAYADLSGKPTIPTVGAAGAGAAVALSSTDASVTNSRTPTAHAASHATGAADPITPAAIGADAAGAASTAQAFAIQRANHTGTQAATTITGLSTVATTGAYADLLGKPTASTLGALSAANNLSDLASAATARTNLSVPLASPNGGVKFRDDISAYNINGDSLRAWRFAYAKAKNGEGRAVISCYGDSTTSGYRATAPQYQNSWVAHMRALIEGRTGVATGTGFVKAGAVGEDAGETRISFTGTWGTAGYGLAMTNKDQLSSTGGTFTIGPITTDRIRLYYLQYAGGGTATVTVDGSAVASINANGATDTKFVDYTMTQGTHSLVLTAPNGSGFDLLGWEAAQNGNLTGIRIDNVGYNGTQASQLQVTSGTSGGSQIAAKGAWETLAPNLAVVMFGANDLGGGGPTPATWQATMTGIVQKAQAIGASVVIMPNMPISATFDPNNYYSQFVAAAYAIADAQNCAVLDVSKQWKDYTTSNAAGLMFDGQHPNNRGYWAFGNFIATALLNVAVV